MTLLLLLHFIFICTFQCLQSQIPSTSSLFFQRHAVETKVETQITSQQSASLPLSSEVVNVSKQKATVLLSVNNGLR